MRHHKKGRILNRNSSHRKAMFSNMSVSLLLHEIIKTTLPKAKELRKVIEPMITLAKKDSVANRRLAFSRLRDKEAVGVLFRILGPKYQERPGGYTRILKCGFRSGDLAPMAYIELVDRDLSEFLDTTTYDVAEKEVAVDTNVNETDTKVESIDSKKTKASKKAFDTKAQEVSVDSKAKIDANKKDKK